MKKSIKWDKKKILTALLVFAAWLMITVILPDSTDADKTGGTESTVETAEGVTDEPTKPPTDGQTAELTQEPTEEPTQDQTQKQTEEPTEAPTDKPTEAPTEEPTEALTQKPTDASGDPPEELIDRGGTYTSKEDVALYLYLYGELPDNFITKSEAEKLGWEGGSVERYAPGKCIGGDKFGNREGLLPKASGRQYYECDIDTLGADSRGAKRIVFSNDGLIYYTDDHYETFELLYTKEGPQ